MNILENISLLIVLSVIRRVPAKVPASLFLSFVGFLRRFKLCVLHVGRFTAKVHSTGIDDASVSARGRVPSSSASPRSASS
jgi:hypothetical protein